MLSVLVNPRLDAVSVRENHMQSKPTFWPRAGSPRRWPVPEVRAPRARTAAVARARTPPRWPCGRGVWGRRRSSWAASRRRRPPRARPWPHAARRPAARTFGCPGSGPTALATASGAGGRAECCLAMFVGVWWVPRVWHRLMLIARSKGWVWGSLRCAARAPARTACRHAAAPKTGFLHTY